MRPAPLIRDATVDDAAGIARLHVASWRWAYQGILPDAVLAGLDVEESTDRRRDALARPASPSTVNWVIADAEALLGWASAGPPRDGDLDAQSDCELYAIYLDPNHVGEGHGRALMQHVVTHAIERGCTAMTMWVLSGNERAHRFYAAAGFRPDKRVTPEVFRDTGASKMRMWRSLR